MRQTITISLPMFLRKKLDREVKQDHLNRSDIIREALRQYFSVQEFKRLRKLSIPLAEKKGFYTDEEIFQEIS